MNKLKIFLSSLLFFISCDSSYDEPEKDCPRHEFLCNGECVFIDEIILNDINCWSKKNYEE